MDARAGAGGATLSAGQQLIAAADYRPHELCYHHDAATGTFQHNVQDDYHCFIVWYDALGALARIRSALETDLDVLCDVEIRWSPAHVAENLARLYDQPIIEGRGPTRVGSGKARKGTLRLFVVRDPAPRYVYERSVSGRIGLANPRIVELKRIFRSWIPAPYQVHASRNIEEFFYQTTLLLGVARLRDVLRGQAPAQEVIAKDLEGCGGWPDMRSLFEVLAFSCDYLVLRDFERLPQKWGADLDVLTHDFQRFASAANIIQAPRRLYNGVLRVDGGRLPVDIRFVTDGYFDPIWQKRLLERKVPYKDLVYVPRDDDLFFSLLYHACVHKAGIHSRHRAKLEELADRAGLNWFDPGRLDDPGEVAEFLSGYMADNGYAYHRPVDDGVYINRAIAKALPGNVRNLSAWEVAVSKLLRALRNMLPPATMRFARAALPARLLRYLHGLS